MVRPAAAVGEAVGSEARELTSPGSSRGYAGWACNRTPSASLLSVLISVVTRKRRPNRAPASITLRLKRGGLERVDRTTEPGTVVQPAPPQGGAVGHRVCRCGVGPAAGSRVPEHRVSLAGATATAGHDCFPGLPAHCARARLVPRRPGSAARQRQGVRDPDRAAAAGWRTFLVGRALARYPRRDGGGSPSAAQPQIPATTGTSIAVLPFVNMSDDKANEYFSDGISEELLNVLVRVDGLGVASRTSSFGYKGSPLGTAAIAQRAQGEPRPRRQRAQVRQSRAHHRAADRCRERPSPVVRDVRPRTDRHLRHPGRNRERDRRRAARQLGTAKNRSPR